MKIINIESPILLQQGIHEGEILEYTIDIWHNEVQIIVGFMESKICLHYSMRLDDSLQNMESDDLVDEESELNEEFMSIVGRKRLFKIELLNTKIPNGSVGMNVITGIWLDKVPEKKRVIMETS